MIHQLNIKNFKSVKDLKLSCKKLNILIGEPNSGKSNILEALALQSQNTMGKELNKQIFRYKTIGDLFFDFNINKPIEVTTDERNTVLKYAIRENGMPENQFHFLLDSIKDKDNPTRLSHDGEINQDGNIGKTTLHYYEYKRLESFNISYMPHLAVPYGENLPSLLLSNEEYKKWVSELFQSKGLKLTLKPTENEISASKFVNNEIYSYPYSSVSETLQRIIFYSIAIKSNKDNILLFDEPESNTFPFYTKYLAERIALDKNNQFFITTHNPYLLLNLMEKSKESDLNVCIVQMKNYKTELTVLNKSQLSKVLDFNSDVFFNFDKIITK